MSNSVLPYSMFLEEGEEPDFIVVRFNCFDFNVLVSEHYCVTPGCSCADARLTFSELSEDGRRLDDWFSITLDTCTWKVMERKTLSKKINADKLIEDFIENIEELKAKIISHFAKAKEYGVRHYLDYVPEDIADLILDGKTVGYSQIFGNKDMDKFCFEFGENEKYIIEDQYCSNPKCQCNEAVLAFFRLDASEAPQECEFAIIMSLKGYKYKIEERNCDADKIKNIIDYIQNNRPEILDILKSRYDEMKSVGREILKKYIKEQVQEQPKVKVGRNDPCPCGSGKKYKKCCGASAQ